jgi:hypothetical protein
MRIRRRARPAGQDEVRLIKSHHRRQLQVRLEHERNRGDCQPYERDQRPPHT